MRSSRGKRAAPRGATHAGLGLQLDGTREAEAASQPVVDIHIPCVLTYLLTYARKPSRALLYGDV